MKDTYISFTTHQARVKKIGPMLSSVLAQWPADHVILTVADNLELPAFIENCGMLIIRSVDYGAFKKHSPLYMDIGIEQYIVADDDCVFPGNWFANLLNWSERLPNQVVCGRGRIWRPQDKLHYPDSTVINAERVAEPTLCHIYVGIGTALFRTDFFEADVFPFPDDPFNYSDDIWFSAKLKESVKIYAIPYSKEENCETFGRPKELEYAHENVSLWKKALAEEYAGWDTALRNDRDRLFMRA